MNTKINQKSNNVPALCPDCSGQTEVKGEQKILDNDFETAFLGAVPTCSPLIPYNRTKDSCIGLTGTECVKNHIYLNNKEKRGNIGTGGNKVQNPLDADFNKWLDSKTTKRLDFKLKNPEYRDIVVYGLASLDIEPTLGNYRQWCQVLDFRAICERDLRKKGVLK